MCDDFSGWLSASLALSVALFEGHNEDSYEHDYMVGKDPNRRSQEDKVLHEQDEIGCEHVDVADAKAEEATGQSAVEEEQDDQAERQF